MRLEYLHDGSPDCPLIRIYEFNAQEVIHLQNLVSELADCSRERFAVHQLPDAEAINECQLTLELGTQNLGVIKGQLPNSFSCILKPVCWDEIARLMDPFCRPLEGRRFQWLDETSPISLLLSTSDHW